MLTTTPFFRPAAGTEPLPMIAMLPSRLTSPMSATPFVVPTSIPTRTASRSTVLVIPRIALGGFGGPPAGAPGTLEEVPADEGHVLEDPRPEGDQGDEVEVETESIADEREEHGHTGIGDESADEDPIVVDAVQLCANRAKDRIECGHDGHRGVAGKLEADVDVEEQTRSHAHEEACQREQHGLKSSLRTGIGQATRKKVAPALFHRLT